MSMIIGYLSITEHHFNTDRYFNINCGYPYYEEANRAVYCYGCTGPTTLRKHYRITIDSTDYWIDSLYTVLLDEQEYNNLDCRTFRERVEDHSDKTTDYVAKCKEVFGVDISKTRHYYQNPNDILKQQREKYRGTNDKNPGEKKLTD